MIQAANESNLVAQMAEASKQYPRTMAFFDDTLLHQSFNETDQPRYRLFVDMIRPTPFPAVMRSPPSAC